MIVSGIPSRFRISIGIAAAALVALAGGVVGWWAKPAPKAVHEVAAPAQRQADGSLVLERRETGNAVPAAPHAIPAGSVEERRVQVIAQPGPGVIVHDTLHDTVRDASGSVQVRDSIVEHCNCPPVTVDLSLVRAKDGRRVVASSPDGKVVSGLDIPIEATTTPWAPRWTLSAIAVGDRDGIRPGAILQRHIGSLVVGGGVLSDPGFRRPGAFGSIGASW